MSILTLTSDWGLRDHYLASFKANIICKIPSFQMIDITHDIEKFNTMQAAFIVRNSFRKFPEGTIHFISVSSNENQNHYNPYIIVRSQGHLLIGEDNGIFSLILGDNEKEIVRLPIERNTSKNELNQALIEALKMVANGTDIYSMGQKDHALTESFFAQPAVNSQSIRGSIFYVDSFGNAIVNITKELFIKERRDREFNIDFRKSEYSVSEISMAYEDVEVGEILALFNQDEFLEIALNKESASKLLGLKLMDPIRIDFNDR